MSEKIKSSKNNGSALSYIQQTQFIKIILNQLGITIHNHQLTDLNKTIKKACDTLNCTPEKYLFELQNSSQDSIYHKLLIKGITIGETYFFRDKNQIELIEHTILPDIIRQKRESNTKSLSIWSAGCASGEELYTIAMMLDRLLPDKNQWTLNLLGTDINIDSLKKAMLGQYSEWSMRAISKEYKERYFTFANNRYQLKEDIKQFARFNYLNLNDNSYPSVLNETNAQDLILCRNVLIYFDTKNAAQVIRKLSQSLCESGYLMLGASDPMIIANLHLEQYFKKGTYFKKISQKSIITSPPQKIVVAPIKKATDTLKKSAEEPRQNDKSPPLNKFTSLEEKAIEYANSGKLELAEQCCKESLAQAPTNSQSHFTLAMIYLEMNKFDEAEKYFRKTLFLDKNFILAHYQLGLLLIRNKKLELGIKSLRNALSMVSKTNPNEMVSGFDELTFGELEKTIKNELELQTKLMCEKGV